jgi:uncharacterized SAM-binding protein YcdF (DUF218 family)
MSFYSYYRGRDKIGLKKRCVLKRYLFKICFRLIAFLFLLLIVEFVWFYFVLQYEYENTAADLIVVFGGAHARTLKGYDLANQGLAPYIIISPSSIKGLKHFDETYRSKSQYKNLIEDRADTTFQNALFVAELSRMHGVRSAILVTDDYHMPRSLFLLKLLLAGSGVKVRPCAIEIGRFGHNPLAWQYLNKKRVYNEMVELWGSVAEMVHYSMIGRLPAKELKNNKVISKLRSIFLFDIQEQ